MDYYANSVLLNDLVEKAADTKFVVLGTHSGEFHADDLLSTAILKHALASRGISVRIVRSRVKSVLEGCDIVYDVGGGMYDHHDIYKVYYPNGIPMASCGKLLNDLVTDGDIAEGLRRRLFYAVEANDNGYELPRFVEPSKLSFVHSFNPTWAELGDTATAKKTFFTVLELVKMVYERTLATVEADIAARDFIAKSARYFGPNKEIMVLPKYCPAQEYARTHRELLATVYKRDDGYVVRCMPTFTRKYETRVSFPPEWHCQSGENLARISGIPGAQFCPDGGYMTVVTDPHDVAKACEILIKRKKEYDLMAVQLAEEQEEKV